MNFPPVLRTTFDRTPGQVTLCRMCGEEEEEHTWLCDGCGKQVPRSARDELPQLHRRCHRGATLFCRRKSPADELTETLADPEELARELAPMTNPPPVPCPHHPGVRAIDCDACALEHDALLERLAQNIEIVRGLARCHHGSASNRIGGEVQRHMGCLDCGALLVHGVWHVPSLAVAAKELDAGGVLPGTPVPVTRDDSASEIDARAKPRT